MLRLEGAPACNFNRPLLLIRAKALGELVGIPFRKFQAGSDALEEQAVREERRRASLEESRDVTR